MEPEGNETVVMTPTKGLVSESVGVTETCASPEMDYLGTPSSSHSGPVLTLSPAASVEALLRALSPAVATNSPGGEPASTSVSPPTTEPADTASKPQTYASVAAELARTGVVKPQPSPEKHEARRKTDVQLEAWDSHFHLDRMARDLGRSWAQMQASLNTPTDVEPVHKVNLTGGVMVFCDPDQFHHLPTMLDRKFVVAIGVHPKKVTSLSANRVAKMKELIEAPRVTAVGEVGLDHSHPRHTWEHQEKVLHQVLGYCTARHTLVLHIRGSRDDRHGQEVSRRCLEIVREHCPPEQYIHLHSFSGGQRNSRNGLRPTPNSYFGFTGLVQRFDRQQRDVVKRLSINRLLVENRLPISANDEGS